MNVLDLTLLWDWCRDHGVALAEDEPDSPEPIRLVEDPALRQRARWLYAEAKQSAREPEVAAEAMRALGAWDECLVWVTGWDAWPSGEDWPRFYAWRVSHGERRSLEAAPGHWFRAGEEAKLEALLTQVMENGWEAAVLPARADAPSDRRLVISHDEWIEIQSRELLPLGGDAGTIHGGWRRLGTRESPAVGSLATPPAAETASTEQEPSAVPAPNGDLLQQIKKQLEELQADLDTIRWRTGCLFAWLVFTLILGAVIALLKLR